MTIRNISIFVLVLLFQKVSSQELVPTDFLSKEFHKNRREALRKIMPKNSVAVFFANPIRNRANDVDYVYHQDPNFYYLTGYKEPHAVLLIFSEQQIDGDKRYDEIIYVQEKNAQAEMWTGKRLGIDGVNSTLGFSTIYNGSNFRNSALNFKKFDKVLLIDFKDDYRDSKENNADLYDLVNDFKTKVGYAKLLKEVLDIKGYMN